MERGELIAGRYEMVKRLGRGGMGEVWAARDGTLQRDVALKLLDLDGAAHPELPQRFDREAVAAAQINHPNVVAVYDRGVHEDMLFLVMEKVEGVTLAEHIHAETPLPLARALEVTGGICAALVAAHRAHVVHYDIKPHNVMLTSDGQVKVVDFGIAGFIQTVFSVARSTQLTPAGTPEYGAPEQFLTERGDERSDLYALGGVLFALLSGRPPFTGHSWHSVIERKRHEEAPRLDSLRPDLPPAVTALIDELLHRDAHRRPQSAQQVQERLKQLQAALDSGDSGTLGLQSPVVVQPPPTRTLDGTRQLAGPFTISWTGREPLSTYTDSRTMRAWSGGLTALLTVAVVGVWIPLMLDRIKPGAGQGDGWIALFSISLTFGVLALIALPLLRLGTYLHRKPGWSLQIGPQGIATTSDFCEREYQWSQVQRIVTKEIDSSSPSYRYTGLHVKFTKGPPPSDAELRPLSDKSCPAGWPPRHPGKITFRENRLVPVCVLGPMTDQQRAELREAVAHYGPRG
ncbi:Serine/threonine-protein kinase PrkC [Streptomyces sp. YIM 130001]|uniref:serine/threonine-protein kinase n=1 Tax=Streptomyces sp. YIM 130001 TaxID=2259644 RepID=UPI000E6540D4|nr:serine/threonine-protein kinase [Streptomyces sp. YIM 130001]RII06867.1 Serine/threonine-protein kinase PrkC [Streptomyces sp. YIM 130001]